MSFEPATIVVDGLSGQSIERFKKSLRKLHINARKVRGVRDESEPLIRLADAVAGFVHDFSEGQTYAAEYDEQAVKSGVLREYEGKARDLARAFERLEQPTSRLLEITRHPVGIRLLLPLRA